MATIAELLASHVELHSESKKLDADVLLSHVLSKPRSYLYTWPEQELEPVLCDRFKALMARRIAGEPIAHLTGIREFWSLPLIVNSTTLIPRPETEQLVETAIKIGKQIEQACSKSVRLLDLGTGSGAIALAIASENSHWQVCAVDKFEPAIQLAKANKQALGINNVEIFQSDWFDAVKGRFDLIVSNPPYIDKTDTHLVQGDVLFEPTTALVADDNGLADIAFIIAHARAFLTSQGWLLIEHGHQQGPAVENLFTLAGFEAITTLYDLAGHERITQAKLNQ